MFSDGGQHDALLRYQGFGVERALCDRVMRVASGWAWRSSTSRFVVGAIRLDGQTPGDGVL